MITHALSGWRKVVIVRNAAPGVDVVDSSGWSR
jgi:hypothetical protein